MIVKPIERLPEGWYWYWLEVEEEWYPRHQWSEYLATNAGKAWWLEACGEMGPHNDRSKVNLTKLSGES